MDILNYIDIIDNSESDSDHSLFELAELVGFPRKAKVIRDRPDHFQTWRDHEFLQRFRLSKNTVKFILDVIETKIASPTNRNNAVTPAQKLLVTLRYYATGSFIAACGDFAGIHKTTTGKIIKDVSEALAELRPDFVYFPSSVSEIRKVRQDFYNIAKFPSCVGALDCTHIKIRSPGGEDAEIFRNRKHFFSINVQTICDAHLRIQNIVVRWPGSTHDSNIFRNSTIKKTFDDGIFKDGVLVADSGYAMQHYVITPLLNPITQAETLFNESQIRTRNPIERSYGVWKRRFPILSLGINIKCLNTVQAIIVATAVLHNIARQFGDNEPKVTNELEHLINLSLVDPQLGQVNEGGNRSIHRKHTTASRKFLQEFLQDIPPPIIGPVFDKTVPNNVTGLVGRTAYLHCRVKNLGNRTVSWIRHRDIHLLTAGRYTYTSDQRFEAIHEPHSENWSLRIKYPQKKDSGIYECQISTTPPIGHPVYLTVLEPTTEILGGPELFIDQGSTINLTCLVQFAPEPPPTVGWTHEKQPINFDSPRGGISLVTEKGSTTSSRLLIQKASSSDTGYYSCDPSNANSATVRVHILNGEHPAAMHHGQGSIPLCPPIVSAMIVPFLLIFTARDL